MNEVGIMGGAFRPIHIWHLMLPVWSAHKFKLELVYMVPSGDPPHKKNVALDKEVRYEMVAAAVADNPLLVASRVEVDREGISWTIDTLKHFKKLHGEGSRLNFIIGEDNVQIFSEYDRLAEIQELARLLIAPRGTYDDTKLPVWQKALPHGHVDIIECPASPLSSTDIRKWIAEGKPYRYAVPPAVYKIIEERGLYKAAVVPAVVPTAVPTDTVPTVVPTQSAPAA